MASCRFFKNYGRVFGKQTERHFVEDKGNVFDCDVHSNKVHAIKWLQTIEAREMRQSEDGLNESATHKLALLPVPTAEIVVII